MIDSLVDIRGTAPEFSVRLDDESWCASYAFGIRWPQGFVCPTCGTAHQASGFQQKPLCRACGRCSSITAGTLLHGSKKSLGTWLRALWWLSGERSSISIMKLKTYMGFRSYQTGWSWMQKLRLIIELTNRRKCRGIVLVDGVPAEVSADSDQLLTAVESVASGRTTGRLQMRRCGSLKQDIIERFCRQTVASGSVIIVPGREPFTSVDIREMICASEDSSFHHDDILRICASYRLWHRRNKGWAPRHWAQSLVDEFCFLYNGRLYTNRVHLFETLVRVALSNSHEDFDQVEETVVSSGGGP